MNITLVDWDSFCTQDIYQALINLSHNVFLTHMTEKAVTHIDEEFIDSFKKLLLEQHSEVVISMNFFPSISIACEEIHCPYISWIYNNPQLLIYDPTVKNECNRIYTFDSHMVTQLQSKGVETIAYAPLASNVSHLTSVQPAENNLERFQCDIAFVGSMYNETNDFYSTLLARAHSPYLQGYLEGLMAAQQKIYGYNFLAECLTPDIVEIIKTHMPQQATENSLLTLPEMYADFFLAKKLATIDRIGLLSVLGNYFDVHVYTHREIPLTNVTQGGSVDYFTEMPASFKLAKINLNITKRSNKNGITLRALDIMGSGGFLLSNFQSDFLLHFEENVHFTFYSSIEEALDKCQFYLTHEEERQKIAQNALEIMSKEHTYEVRLSQMLEEL